MIFFNDYFTIFVKTTKIFHYDEIFPNFIKRKCPKKERKRNKGQGPKSRQTNNPKLSSHKEVKGLVSTKTLTSRLKHIN
jgi:hypothetical protein